MIGGETAEMPGLYATNDYDVAGTILGVVEKTKIIDKNNVKPGDILIGFFFWFAYKRILFGT